MHKVLSGFILLFAAFLVLGPTAAPAYALSNAQLKVYNSGVFAYDAAVGADCDTSLTGDSVQAKIWGWLTAKGMSGYGAAGIMGNMSVESEFNPYRIQGDAPLRTYDAMVGSSASDSGFGLVQWDGPRRVEILKVISGANADYRQYVSDAYGKSPENYKSAPADVTDRFITLELEFLYKEATPGGSRPTTWSKLLSAQSASAAADVFEEIFEGSVRTGGGPHTTAADTIYRQFGSSGAVGGSNSSCGSLSGNLVTGGMNMSQAKAFMQKYIDFAKKQNSSLRKLHEVTYNGKKFMLWFSGCSGGVMANCSTFTEFFVGAYTKGEQAFPDGRFMVSQLLATKSGFVDGGHTPKVYAIFSRASGGDGHGHTGVVLGIDRERNKIIIGQAGCGAELVLDNNYTVEEYPLNTWTNNSDYTYAYTDAILLGGL
jgi:hypothetical protein